jgi:hypothetical protein
MAQGTQVTDHSEVFVSYVKADRSFARALVRALSALLPGNIRFVMDVNVVSPGDNIYEGVVSALKKAKAAIVIISPASASSAWTRAEVAWLLAEKNGNLPIFPVLAGQPVEVPHLLRSLSYVDFSHTETFQENAALLAEAILRRIDAPQSAEAHSRYRQDIQERLIDTQSDILEASRQHLFRQREHLNEIINRIMLF